MGTEDPRASGPATDSLPPFSVELSEWASMPSSVPSLTSGTGSEASEKVVRESKPSEETQQESCPTDEPFKRPLAIAAPSSSKIDQRTSVDEQPRSSQDTQGQPSSRDEEVHEGPHQPGEEQMGSQHETDRLDHPSETVEDSPLLDSSGMWEYCVCEEPVEDEPYFSGAEPRQVQMNRYSCPDVATLLIDHINTAKMEEFNGMPVLRVTDKLSCVARVILAGVVKSVSRYERRTVVVVEDGTGSIECVMYPDENRDPGVDLDAVTGSVVNADLNDSFALEGVNMGDTLEEDLKAFAEAMETTSIRRVPRVGAIVMVHGRVSQRATRKAVTVEVIYEATENMLLAHIKMMTMVYPLYAMEFPVFLSAQEFKRLFAAKDEAELAEAEALIRVVYQGSSSESFFRDMCE